MDVKKSPSLTLGVLSFIYKKELTWLGTALRQFNILFCIMACCTQAINFKMVHGAPNLTLRLRAFLEDLDLSVASAGAALEGRRYQLVQMQAVAQHLQESDFLALNLAVDDGDFHGQGVSSLA